MRYAKVFEGAVVGEVDVAPGQHVMSARPTKPHLVPLVENSPALGRGRQRGKPIYQLQADLCSKTWEVVAAPAAPTVAERVAGWLSDTPGLAALVRVFADQAGISEAEAIERLKAHAR